MTMSIPTLRHFVSRPSLRFSNSQRRWARVLDVRFLATQDPQARILSKYQEKLQQKAKQYVDIIIPITVNRSLMSVS